MKSRSLTATLFFLALFAGVAIGRFAQPSLMPTERLLERVHAHLKDDPEDAAAHYTLGRIHYLSFYNRASEVAVYGLADADILPSVAPYWTAEESYIRHAQNSEARARVLKKYGVEDATQIPEDKVREFYQEISVLTQELAEKKWHPEPAQAGIAAEHATLALKSFDKAIDLDPENSLYLLGKASLLEQARVFYGKEKPKRVDPVLAGLGSEGIRDAYYRSFATGVKEALELDNQPVAGLRSIASYEAGSAYQRLCEGQADLSETEKKRLAEVREKLAKLDQLRRGAITPIIFSTEENVGISDLLEPGAKAAFDLDGDGVVEEWPWLRAGAGFLVWDPARSGHILSGRQLFGSYTWQIPFENGYEPLAMLDATGDGLLSGAELDGIRAWFDRNRNGASDPGEVVDLETLGIDSIATSGERTSQAAASLTNPQGIRLKSGAALPSWDWVPGAAE